MDVYFDTSALVKLYVSEANSDRARTEAARVGQIIFTPLQSLELQAAIRQLIGRGTLAASALGSFEQHHEADRRSHRLRETSVDLAGIFHRADQLTRIHTQRLLCPLSTCCTSRLPWSCAARASFRPMIASSCSQKLPA